MEAASRREKTIGKRCGPGRILWLVRIVTMARASDTRPVAFFDSGVGGLPYLEVAKRLMPGERYVYLCDSAGFPYGQKDRQAVRDLVLSAVGMLVKKTTPKALVVACNTATQIALAELRAAHPELPIVGTVPAVKPAALSSRSRVIGVVATARAVADPYLSDLAARFAPDCTVIRRGEPELVDFVEKRYMDSNRAQRLDAIRPAVLALAQANADAIVLACTHFLFLANEFAELAGPGIRIVDSRDGVASQLRRVLAAGPGIRKGRSHGHDEFWYTGSDADGTRFAPFAARFGLTLAGCIAR